MRPAELRIHQCNDVFAAREGTFTANAGIFAAISCLPHLTRLSVEEVHYQLDRQSLICLSRLSQVGGPLFTSFMVPFIASSAWQGHTAASCIAHFLRAGVNDSRLHGTALLNGAQST